MATKKRDYKAEYQRRIAAGIARGFSRSQSRGHAKKTEQSITKETGGKRGASKITFKKDANGWYYYKIESRNIKDTEAFLSTLKSNNRVWVVAEGHVLQYAAGEGHITGRMWATILPNTRKADVTAKRWHKETFKDFTQFVIRWK